MFSRFSYYLLWRICPALCTTHANNIWYRFGLHGNPQAIVFSYICYARHPSCEWRNSAMTSDSEAKNLIKRLHIYNTVIRRAYLINCQTSLWIHVTLLVPLKDDEYCFRLLIKTLWRYSFVLAVKIFTFVSPISVS